MRLTKKYFTLKEASKTIGAAPYVIRRLEKTFNIGCKQRKPGCKKRYSVKEVITLNDIHKSVIEKRRKRKRTIKQ